MHHVSATHGSASCAVRLSSPARSAALSTVLAIMLAGSPGWSSAQAQAAPVSATVPGPGPGARPAPPPVEDFFGPSDFSSAVLSPSGRYLAVKMANTAGRERLAVVDLSNNSVASVANFNNADVGNFAWVNDERLLFDSADKQLAKGDLRYAPGLYAANRDGSAFRQLAVRGGVVPPASAGRMLPWNTYMLGQWGAQDSDSAYVTRVSWEGSDQIDHIDLILLNTKTGATTTVNRPGGTRGWLLDAKGEPRIALASDKGQASVQYRDPSSKEWRTLASFGRFTGGKGAFRPLAFGPDGTLYVVSYGHDDKAAVHVYDLARGKIDETPLVQLDGFDFSGRLIMNKDKLLGVRYLADTRDTRWFDPAMQAVQADVDARLPGTVNLISLPSRPETPNMLVEAFSDVQPRLLFLYNSETRKLNPIGATHPKIKPEQMGPQKMVSYAARDGLPIPAWLTLPRGQDKNLPLVVLVHGGPYVRGSEWGWSPASQFLASRGYAVLEPEFRGSTGFGDAHFRAGWKQWGLKMQDDIADGVRWAVAQGVADGKRVCIAGASYGGYATLMGLIKDPELYRCGIDWAGVTDIKLLYTGSWNFHSDVEDEWRQYGMPVLVGDPEKDAAQLNATSPLLHADRIRQPLLLAYGTADTRVPLYHGRKFRDAVQAGNKQVEWVEYAEEGHGWDLPKTRYDFWTRVERFLSNNIGPASGLAEGKK